MRPLQPEYNNLRLIEGTAATPDVRALLSHHFEVMRAHSPLSSCHVMEPEELIDARATLLTARELGELLGVGAIREIGPGHAELKSMHTSAAARGRGVGQTILTGLLDHARNRNWKRVSLETGTIDLFAPARALYQRNGFSECPPFGDYVTDPLSVFMTRTL
ncbi:GNAT family N-acetyltransferase [Sulfitobacter sp. JB4-11]|uniref:GNAT family N-acetyltransferase n=1 Tax=Sulfitobacter rhodophyticola TaxID=3238304 RepID=UPI003519CBF9